MAACKTVLEDLYYGNISPWETCCGHSAEYAKNAKIISDSEGKLNGLLRGTQEGQALFAHLMSAQSEILDFSELDRFIEGFRLGAAFMLDALVIPGRGAADGGR